MNNNLWPALVWREENGNHFAHFPNNLEVTIGSVEVCPSPFQTPGKPWFINGICVADEDTRERYEAVDMAKSAFEAQLTAWVGNYFLPSVLTPGSLTVVKERERQIMGEGFTVKNDREAYTSKQLARAAFCYLAHYVGVGILEGGWWPWTWDWFKPSTPERSLAKAGALVMAELDRLAGGKEGE